MYATTVSWGMEILAIGFLFAGLVALLLYLVWKLLEENNALKAQILDTQVREDLGPILAKAGLKVEDVIPRLKRKPK